MLLAVINVIEVADSFDCPRLSSYLVRNVTKLRNG